MEIVMFICQGWKCQKSENRSQIQLGEKKSLSAWRVAAAHKRELSFIWNVEEAAATWLTFEKLVSEEVRRWEMNESVHELREMMQREQKKVRWQLIIWHSWLDTAL